MAYRPQRLVTIPEGWNAEPFIVPVVASDVNQGNAILAGLEYKSIPIPMDRDFDFWLLGFAYSCPQNIDSLGFRLRDSWGNYLSDDYCAAAFYALPAGVNPAIGGGYAPVVEPPLYCPHGSVLQLDVKNLLAVGGPAYVWGNMELRGFKVVPIGACAA